MHWFNDLSIAGKLAIAFSLLALLAIGVTAYALFRLGAANAQLQDISTHAMPNVQHLGEFRAQLGEYRTYEIQKLNRFDEPEAVRDYDARMAEIERDIAERRATYERIPFVAGEEALYRSVADSLDAYFAAHREVEQAFAAGDLAAAEAISDDKSRVLRRTALETLSALSAFNVERLDADIARSNATHRSTVIKLVIAITLFLVVAVALGTFIAQTLTRSIGSAVNVAEDVSAGRLDGQIPVGRRDEAGKLLEAMSRMQTQLRAVIGAQRHMAREHDAGAISYRMDAQAFPGDYGVMVAETNALVAGHMRSRCV